MKCSFTMVLRVALVVFLIVAVTSSQTVPAWQPDTNYAVGALVTFNGAEFKCLQAHRSQIGWEPPNVPALWQPVAPAAPDFSLVTSPAAQSLVAGGHVNYTVTVNALNSFNGGVSLSASGLPGGATATFNPSLVTGSGTSTLTISTTSATPVGNSNLTIRGASGSLAHTASTSLNVTSSTPGFSISATPALQTLAAGGSASYTVSVAALNGFNGVVSLKANGLPVGTLASFTPATITGSGSSVLNLTTSNSTPSANATISITGTSGSLSQSTSVGLNVGGVAAAKTTGVIHFHLLLGVGNAQDSLTLDGDNFTDLIMSNMIAGVMTGHLIQEYSPLPGVQFNKDYLYGSVMAQLLQENIATQDYVASSNLIDPSPDQQAVMSTGQGGPYQINNYAVDLVDGGTAPTGHSLINYIAIQKGIGFTIANASSQFNQPTPPSFNNKFYGPMLTTFFHYNDFVSLNVIGKGAGAFTPPWQPQYDQALANFVNLPNSFLDVILNVAYNQGFYGGLVSQYGTRGVSANAATVASVNSYSSIWGNTSTFAQYPYQVHYYLDQMYDNPIPTTDPSTLVTPANHILFSMTALEGVFANVFQMLAHSNGTSPAQFFTASEAQAAFNSALAQHGVSNTATLDLSNAKERSTIFAVIDSAIGNLEASSGMKFNATTTQQL